MNMLKKSRDSTLDATRSSDSRPCTVDGLLIRLRCVERSYSVGRSQFFYVLRDIILDIAEGDFVSIMGPSGAGKSTLLHILGMHDHSWAGEYYFDDVAVHTMDHKKRANLRNSNIGFVFQSYHLLDDQTVFENLELP